MAILLMTATITPPSTAVRLSRTDPQARRQDYAEALNFYIERLEAGVLEGIVFVDNSNSSVAQFEARTSSSSHREKIEFISFYGLDYPPEHGRGYGEMRLVDHAMKNSRLIGAAGADAVIWKVTGRYIIKNIEKLLESTDGSEMYCHCRNHPMRWADMYFMGWTIGAYPKILANSAESIKESPAGVSSEIKFRDLVDAKAKAFKVRRRFPVAPEIVGVKGWDSQKYQDKKIKSLMRAVLARIAPWVWV